MPTDLRIIDLQLLKRTSPTLDLSIFYGNSTTPKFRSKHKDHWNKLYHTELTAILSKLGHSPETLYPYSVFKQDLQDMTVFLLHWSFTRALVRSKANPWYQPFLSLFPFSKQWYFGPVEELKQVATLEQELAQWNRLWAKSIACPSEQLRSMISEIFEDAFQKGYF